MRTCRRAYRAHSARRPGRGRPRAPPTALGTSRVVDVGTEGGLEVGLKTYDKTIPLADHEVILTFDDGPDAISTPKILDALGGGMRARDLLLIGRNAEGLPQTRAARGADGHTVRSPHLVPPPADPALHARGGRPSAPTSQEA